MSIHTLEQIHRKLSLGSTAGATETKAAAERALADTKQTPSIWFVDVTSQDAKATASEQIVRHNQETLAYRCWASWRWWKGVFDGAGVPQDDSRKSTDERSAYAASLAVHNIRMTPWLSMIFDRDVERKINCKVSEFQTELVNNFLRGFVEVTPAVLKAFQTIFRTISKAMEESATSGDKQTIILEKYAHNEGSEDVSSTFRVISFSISDPMKKALLAKGSRGDVACEIEYDEFEAEFDATTWREALASFRQVQMDAIVAFGAFVQNQSIHCEA